MGFMVQLLLLLAIPAIVSCTKEKPNFPETNRIFCGESLLSKTVGIHRVVGA